MKSFLSKKSILRTMAVAAVCMLGATSVKAQEFTIQGDFVSSYVWRGIYQGGAASFQPTLGFSAGNFSLTAWGSTSLSESNKVSSPATRKRRLDESVGESEGW